MCACMSTRFGRRLFIYFMCSNFFFVWIFAVDVCYFGREKIFNQTKKKNVLKLFCCLQTEIMRKFIETLSRGEGERLWFQGAIKGKEKSGDKIRSDGEWGQSPTCKSKPSATKHFIHSYKNHSSVCHFLKQNLWHVSLLWIDKVTNYQGTRALCSDIYTIPCPFIQIKQGNTQRKLVSRLSMSHSGTSKPFQISVGWY